MTVQLVLIIFITAGIIFTIRNIRRWIKRDGIIPTYFFLSGPFIIHIIGMVFIAIAIFWAQNPLDITTYMAIIVGMILGLINAMLSTLTRHKHQS